MLGVESSMLCPPLSLPLMISMVFPHPVWTAGYCSSHSAGPLTPWMLCYWIIFWLYSNYISCHVLFLLCYLCSQVSIFTLTWVTVPKPSCDTPIAHRAQTPVCWWVHVTSMTILFTWCNSYLKQLFSEFRGWTNDSNSPLCVLDSMWNHVLFYKLMESCLKLITVRRVRGILPILPITPYSSMS